MNQKLKTREGYPPGVWEDEDGCLHFSLPEIMEHLGVPYTPHNEERMRQLYNDLLREKLPEAEIINQKDCPVCHWRGPEHRPGCSMERA